MKKKTRGSTTCKKKISKYGTSVSIEFDPHGQAIGQHARYFKSYIGGLVRNHIDINITDWHQVDQGLKDMIWEDTKKHFNIPNDDQKRITLKAAGAMWRGFKTRLVGNFIKTKHKTYSSPRKLYTSITSAQWEKFVEDRQTDEFKEKSKKASESQSQNVHPHYLGPVGYIGKRPEWIKSDPLSSSSSCALMSSAIPSHDRSLDWLRARSKKGEDGNYYIPNDATKAIFEKIVEKGEETTQGSFVPKRHHDILSAALGKEEHPGRVRGVGGYIGIRDVFGKPDQIRGRSAGFVSVDDLKEIIRNEVKQEMQSKIDMLENKLDLVFRHMSQHMPDVDLGAESDPPASVQQHADPPPAHSSCHSVDPSPFSLIQNPIQCNLALCVDGDTKVVARGMVHPIEPHTVVHHQKLLPGHVKVSVDEIVDGAELLLLPMQTQYHTRVGEVIGSFTQWPMHLVLLGEEDIKSKLKRKGHVYMTGEISSVVDATLQYLGKNCKRLHSLLISMPASADYFQMDLDQSVFHHSNVSGIFVMIKDIVDLFKMDWLDVSIIQVFILYLNGLCEQFNIEYIGFLCLSQIAMQNINLNVSGVTSYLTKAMLDMTRTNFILAPYHQDDHWLLLVICIASSTVYILDSKDCMRTLGIKAPLNVAFRSYWDQVGKKGRNTIWTRLKCPQQPGGSECGYYVMRFMWEICTKKSDASSLDKDSFGDKPYTQEQIDEIRELWAQYFIENGI